jgi:PAS domain S-box-containing protein
VLDVNQATWRLYGAQNKAELLGHPDWVFGAEAMPLIGQELAALARGDREFEAEGVNHRLNGEPFDVAVHWTVPPDSSSPCVIVSISDISRRNAAERALLASEARYRALFEAANDAIFLNGLRPDGTPDYFLAVNKVAVERLGYSEEEFATLTPVDIDAKESAEARRQALKTVQRDGYATFETVHLTKDGRRIPVEISVREVVMGERPLAVSIARDLTERKRAEAALRESEERFRSIFMNMPVGLVRTTPDGRILLANPAFCQMLGYAPEALHQVNLETECRGNYDRAEFKREVEANGVITGREVRWTKPDGTVAIMRESARAVRAPSGEVLYYEGIVEDITERKQAEDLIQAQYQQLQAQHEELVAQEKLLREADAKLRQMNALLEQRVVARTEELNLANAALVRADRLKDEFLANMSHELRTPLTGILGLAELMDQDIYGPLNEKQSHALRLIHSSSEHLLGLINDILDLSKVEAGKMDLQLGPVEVETACHASLAFVLKAAQKKNIQWSFRPDRRVEHIMADGRRLKQMLVNLLSNAVKFTPEGGRVGLEVEGDPSRQEVRFTVWDTGIGIPREQQRYLFKPFVQLNGSLARQYEGTGLGLALVHSLVELHGGRVEVESAGAGQGSRFTLILPWLLDAAPEAPRGAAPGLSNASQGIASFARRMGRPPVILAVDDSRMMLTLVTNFLEALNCEVLTAQDGAQALDLAYSAHPDLVLLDIQMPHVDGLVVLQELRSHWARPPVPVIVLTALAMTGDRERYLAAGADDYLSKPMHLDDLARAIGRQLERSLEDTAGHSDAVVDRDG